MTPPASIAVPQIGGILTALMALPPAVDERRNFPFV
jgi:hypothetical protein